MSALTKAVTSNTARLCSVAEARATLDPDSTRDFDAWMAGNDVEVDGKPVRLTDAMMWAALQGLKYRVGLQSLGRHRRGQGECGCRA